MSKLTVSKGNMYKWVTHQWNPDIHGCPYGCVYCYVKAFKPHARKLIIEKDYPPLGTDRTIFVGHLTDLFAEEVPIEVIMDVRSHLLKYPQNSYVLQSKNPMRIYRTFFEPETYTKAELEIARKIKWIVGTTIETNREEELKIISNAPSPIERRTGMVHLRLRRNVFNMQVFVTIEPIMDFDLDIFDGLIYPILPDFINVGADSKGHNLPEPSPEKIRALIQRLENEPFRFRIINKGNLSRLSSEFKEEPEKTKIEPDLFTLENPMKIQTPEKTKWESKWNPSRSRN